MGVHTLSAMDDRRTVENLRQADLAFAGSVLGLILLWSLFYSAFPTVAILLFLGSILTYALLPVVDWLHERRVPRTVSVLLVALVGAGLIVLLVLLLAPVVAEQVAAFPEMLSDTWRDLKRLWNDLRDRLPPGWTERIDRLAASMQERAEEEVPSGTRLTDWATRAAGGIGAVASGMVFVPILVFLMLRSYHRFADGAASLVPPRWRERFFERTAQADAVLAGFVRGQLLVALVIGGLYAIAFSIIGIPLALVVGLVAGLGELVPFLGGAVALLLASLLALAGGEPLDVLWVAIAFVAVQAIEGGVISPWIMGRKAHIGPAVVIVALAVGGELFGLVGLLAAVPFAALLKVAARAAIDAYRSSPFFARTAPRRQQEA